MPICPSREWRRRFVQRNSSTFRGSARFSNCREGESRRPCLRTQRKRQRMNTMIAKVIAFELGLLIAILTWIAFTDFPKSPIDRVATAGTRTDDSFATVSSVPKAMAPRRRVVDYRADEETPALEEAEPIQTVETYDEGNATEPYVDSGYGNYATAPDPRNYIGDYPEPVLDEPYCYADPFYPAVSYQQPAQIIVLSNSRSSGRRHRIASRRRGGRMTVAPRPPRREPRREAPRPRGRRLDSNRHPSPRTGAVAPRRAGVTPRRTTNARSALAGQGSRTRWNR